MLQKKFPIGLVSFLIAILLVVEGAVYYFMFKGAPLPAQDQLVPSEFRSAGSAPAPMSSPVVTIHPSTGPEDSWSSILQQANQANYCKTAADCLSAGDSCLFNCGKLVNKNEVVSLRKQMANFEKNYPGVCTTNECASGPAYVSCDNNKCAYHAGLAPVK